MLTLGVRRIGESRKPADMLLKYEDGDAGGKEDGGVMAMEFDNLGPPLQSPAENEVFGKASAPRVCTGACTFLSLERLHKRGLARSGRGHRRRGRKEEEAGAASRNGLTVSGDSPERDWLRHI